MSEPQPILSTAKLVAALRAHADGNHNVTTAELCRQAASTIDRHDKNSQHWFDLADARGKEIARLKAQESSQP